MKAEYNLKGKERKSLVDEKYASVILRRYAEDTKDEANIFCIRNGSRIPYADLVKEVEGRDV